MIRNLNPVWKEEKPDEPAPSCTEERQCSQTDSGNQRLGFGFGHVGLEVWGLGVSDQGFYAQRMAT